jgi:hypothetical protein
MRGNKSQTGYVIAIPALALNVHRICAVPRFTLKHPMTIRFTVWTSDATQTQAGVIITTNTKVQKRFP